MIMGLLIGLLVLCMASLGSSQSCQGPGVFNVLNFGAVGNGIKDDSKAFSAAWTAACGAASSASTLCIPQGNTFLLNPITFQGPCKSSSFTVQVNGNLVAPVKGAWPNQKLLTWIAFSKVNGLIVTGTGQFDGKGATWWNQPNSARPLALLYDGCNNLQIKGVTHINSPKTHMRISDCAGLTISNINIIAPQNSPNTDGIDIARTSNAQIRDSNIGTGDDCIALNGGSSNINITGIACGPGHGISVGSLGANGARETAEEIHVRSSSFKGTLFGARIKTSQGGSGYARHISFEDITLIQAANPILINQYYCIPTGGCPEQAAAVQVSDVTFNGFHGTTITDQAVKLSCSKTVACTGIVLQDINITAALPNHILSSSCLNAHGTSTAISPKVTCLLS
ncbi:probable polygalacturonase At3g15720 [Actinidia eriantha]|uniref:probable polygalacturonase At3g15720 n=1 Tax=Actinidia eriantha TaxID=165200 RepID=UPI002582D15D|nr:probable polygalacturonase At3g15720 [Actinidia eriantha]